VRAGSRHKTVIAALTGRAAPGIIVGGRLWRWAGYPGRFEDRMDGGVRAPVPIR
jgi:hypothetical protein